MSCIYTVLHAHHFESRSLATRPLSADLLIGVSAFGCLLCGQLLRELFGGLRGVVAERQRRRHMATDAETHERPATGVALRTHQLAQFVDRGCTGVIGAADEYHEVVLFVVVATRLFNGEFDCVVQYALVTLRANIMFTQRRSLASDNVINEQQWTSTNQSSRDVVQHWFHAIVVFEQTVAGVGDNAMVVNERIVRDGDRAHLTGDRVALVHDDHIQFGRNSDVIRTTAITPPHFC